LIVSVNAAISGNPEIAMGNVIGSNIVNIALILAITAILIPIPVNRNTVRFDWPVMMIASILLYLFIMDNNLVFFEGLIFVGMMVTFIWFLIFRSKKAFVETVEIAEIQKSKSSHPGLALLFIILSSAGLAFGAELMVNGASEIASSLGVSKRIISLTIVAIGTSAPELTSSVIAALKKETDIAIGNIIGSNIFNIFAVLGISSMIHDISVDHFAFSFDIIWMIFVAILLFFFIYPFKTIYLTRIEGFILLAAYCIYLFMLLFGYDFESIADSLALIN
jgi:cation:H+ antiporter